MDMLYIFYVTDILIASAMMSVLLDAANLYKLVTLPSLIFLIYSRDLLELT